MFAENFKIKYNIIQHTITGVLKDLHTFFELADFQLRDLVPAVKLREVKFATQGGWNFPSR